MTEEIEIVTEGEAKDLILEYALKMDGKTITAHEIHKEVLPDVSSEEVEFLFRKIQNTSDQVADVRISEHACLIISTGITKKFIEQGGFSQSEKESNELKSKQAEREQIEFEKAKIDLELAKKMLKEYPKTKWFARIAFFIALALGLLELVKFIKG